MSSDAPTCSHCSCSSPVAREETVEMEPLSPAATEEESMSPMTRHPSEDGDRERARDLTEGSWH
jgi:hypothetical protein